MMQSDDSIEITLHDSQALIQVINANVTYCAWQRAGGKTGGGIGPRVLRLSEIMPRSQCLLFSDTYDRLTTRIVPNIIGFLEQKHGLVEGVDFVKYSRPPAGFEKPLIPLDKFDRVISFSSGFCLCLVSLHVEGSANAFNAQAAIGDEVKFCDETEINTEVLPALRGSREHFEHLPEYLSVWMFTDKFGPKIKWYLKKREKVNKRAVEVVYTLQMEVFKLQTELQEAESKYQQQVLKKKIIEYQAKADAIRKHLVYFSNMKPYENMAAVGDVFFRVQRRVCKSQLEFDVAILNHDPDKVENCFYPTFGNLNKYAIADKSDINPNQGFIIALDYNFRIVPIPIAQTGKLPGSIYTTLNVVDYVYELYPKGIEDAVDTFCKRHEDHPKKLVHFIHDHTAIGRNALKVTYKEAVVKAFVNNKWLVIPHHIGEAPDHDVKFPNIRKWLINAADGAVKVNTVTCPMLISSIEQSPAKIITGKTQKDKQTEKDLNFPAQESTHGSDAFDTLLWGYYVSGVRLSSTDHAPMRTHQATTIPNRAPYI